MRFDRIIGMLGTGWAIQPETLAALADALDVLIAGGAPNVEAFAARAEEDGEEPSYELAGNVAVLPVVGTLVKRNSWLSCFNTYSDVQQALARALDDPRAAAILLLIDSPGGTVDGCQELADFIASADAIKPVYAFADGQMTSAAYWIGASAREVAAPPTAVVGSIGVLSVHYDRSGMDEKAGLKRTFLSAGKFKAVGHDAAPLSDAARSVIQGFLDDTYDIFLGGVSERRGLDKATASDWADGRVFLAEAARQAGLIDHVMNLDAFLSRIQAQLAAGQTIKGERTMDLNKLKAEHPGLVQALRAEFEAEATAKAPDVGKVKAEAAKSERSGVLAVAEGMLGKDVAAALGTKLEALDKAGITPEQAKALAEAGLLAQAAPEAKAEEKPGKMDKMLQAITDAGAKSVDPAKPGSPDQVKKDKIKAAMVAGAKGVL